MKRLMTATVLFTSIVLTACGGGDESTSSTTTSSTTSSSTPTSLSAAPISCATDDLDVSVVAADAGAGQRYVTFGLRNKTADSCVTRGYPGMAFYSGEDLVISGVDRAPNQTVSDVTIKPDMRAFFDMAYSIDDTGNAADCGPITRIDFTPPNERTQLSLPIGETDLLRTCPSSEVTVTAFRSAQAPS